jgi:hypothetical protein
VCCYLLGLRKRGPCLKSLSHRRNEHINSERTPVSPARVIWMGYGSLGFDRCWNVPLSSGLLAYTRKKRRLPSAASGFFFLCKADRCLIIRIFTSPTGTHHSTNFFANRKDRRSSWVLYPRIYFLHSIDARIYGCLGTESATQRSMILFLSASRLVFVLRLPSSRFTPAGVDRARREAQRPTVRWVVSVDCSVVKGKYRGAVD